MGLQGHWEAEIWEPLTALLRGCAALTWANVCALLCGGLPFYSLNTYPLQIDVLGSCDLKSWTSSMKTTKLRLSPFCCFGAWGFFCLLRGFFVCFGGFFCLVFGWLVLVSFGFGFSFDWLVGFWKGSLYIPGSVHLHISASDSSVWKQESLINFWWRYLSSQYNWVLS